MNKSDCYQLGNVAKLHGFKGEVSLFLDVTDPSEYRNLKEIYIDIDEFLTPFLIKKINLSGKNFAIVKLEGIESESDARSLLKRKVYLPIEMLPELDGNNFYDHEVVGFSVITKSHGNIGVIEHVLDLPSNPLFQIKHPSDKEILIPIIKENILQIDRKKKEIHMVVPDGLIELYL